MLCSRPSAAPGPAAPAFLLRSVWIFNVMGVFTAHVGERRETARFRRRAPKRCACPGEEGGTPGVKRAGGRNPTLARGKARTSGGVRKGAQQGIKTYKHEPARMEGGVRDIVRSETADAGSGRHRQDPGRETHNEGNDPDAVEAVFPIDCRRPQRCRLQGSVTDPGQEGGSRIKTAHASALRRESKEWIPGVKVTRAGQHGWADSMSCGQGTRRGLGRRKARGGRRHGPRVGPDCDMKH